MFVNQINSKDLFTTNPLKVYGGKEYSDSQGNSQMCSQLEFSNTNTNSSQECFSQQMNVGFSQNESPQKKSYYQKFVSRGPLFTHGSKQQPSTSRITCKPDLDGNKGRAKERDERDLLYTIVNTVSQCATEVKSAVELVKENSQNASAASDNIIADFLHSLQSELDKRYEDIVTAVGKRGESKVEIHSLNEQIAAKNATISELREKVKKLEEEQDEKIVETLRDVYREQQELNREQIHQYHEKQLKELSKQANLHKGYQATLDSHAVQLKHNREKTQQQLCQLEAHVSKELDTYQREQQNRYSQITSDCQEQLKNLHREQRGELVDYFNKQMAKTNNLNSRRQQELQKQFREEIESLGKQQKVELGAMIQQELETKTQQDKGDKVLQWSLDKHENEREKLVQELQYQKMQRQRCANEMEKQSQACVEDEMHQLQKGNATKKEQAERGQKKPKEIQQDELENLRRKHEQEFETLRQKHQTNSAEKPDGYWGERSQPVSHQAYTESVSQFNCPDIDYMGRYDSNASANVKLNARKAKSPFVSPSFRKTGWSSEELFRKGGPSPVATVYPQKASAPSCNSRTDDKAACPDDEDKEAAAPVPTGNTKGRKPKRGRRKKSSTAPSRRQPKRTASTPNSDQPKKQDNTPAWVPDTRRRNASETLPPRKATFPDWIPKKRKAITPSMEKPHQNPSTPSWLQAHRDACNREPQMYQCKETAVVEYTPPIWKKQHCDDSLAWQNSNVKNLGWFQSPYSLRSYGNTPKMGSGHIECSKIDRQRRHQSPHGLRQYGECPKPLNSNSMMKVFDFVEDDVSISGSASYRKMTFGKKRLPSTSPADSRPSHSKGYGDNSGYVMNNSDDSENSQSSSPSLSVTEFVLKRKTKKERSPPPPGAGAGDWQYMTSYDQNSSLMSTSRGDMFGSPDAFKPQGQSSNMPMRQCMKRRLCEDDMIDTQILEITRCIKRQQRVTPKYGKDQ